MSYHPFMDVSRLSGIKSTRPVRCRMFGHQSASNTLRLRNGPISLVEGIGHPSSLPSSLSHKHALNRNFGQGTEPRRNSELSFVSCEDSQFECVDSFIDTAGHHHDTPMESQCAFSTRPWFQRRVFQAYERVSDSPLSCTSQSKPPFLSTTRDRSLAESKRPLLSTPSSRHPQLRQENSLYFESRSLHAGFSLPTKANVSRHQSRGYIATCSKGSSVCSESQQLMRQLHDVGLEVLHDTGYMASVVPPVAPPLFYSEQSRTTGSVGGHLFSHPPPRSLLVLNPSAKQSMTSSISIGNAGLTKRQLKRNNRKERLERLGLYCQKRSIQSRKSNVICYFRHGKMSFTSKSLEKKHSRMRAKIRQAISSGVLADEVEIMRLEYKSMKEEYRRLICAAKQEFLKNLDARGSVKDVTEYVVDNLLCQVGYFVRNELKREMVERQQSARCTLELLDDRCDSKALGMGSGYGTLSCEGPYDLALATNSICDSGASISVGDRAAEYRVGPKALSQSHVAETTVHNSTQSFADNLIESNQATGDSTCLAPRMQTDKSVLLDTGLTAQDIYGSQCLHTTRTSVGSALYQGEMTYDGFLRQAQRMKLPDGEDMRQIRTMFTCTQPNSQSILVPSPQVMEGRGS